MRLAGHVAIVTGGASGIGRAVCERFAREGASVVVADLDATMAADAAAEIEAGAGTARAIPLDVREPDQVEALIAGTERALGPPAILITCAGIGRTLPILETDLATWNETLAVNLTGTFLCAKAAARRMVAQSFGRIVMIGSINSRRPISGRNAYAVSKAGVLSLMRVMAIELAPHGITVNGIAPGPIDTAMARAMHTEATRSAYHARIPMRRYGMVEEVADAAAFLASDEASYITGHMLDVDGGFDAAGMLFDLDAS
jgi:3-oxoacyl-[acyl-carrier protein] reductase